MIRLALVAAAFTSTLVLADYTVPGTQQSRLTLGADAPGCYKDTDCKGDRICVAGVCQSPAPGPVPMVPADTSNAASNSNAMHRLVMIAQQLEILELSRPGMGLPIFLTVFGGVGVMTGGVFIILISYAAYLGAIISGISLIPLSIGIVLWVVNGAKNRGIDADVKKLRAERASLGVSSLLVEPPQMIELARF